MDDKIKDENNDDVQEFKNSFKKSDVSKRKEFNYKRFLPYIIVFAGFIASIIIIIIFVNSYLLPNLVHNKQTVRVPDLYGLSLDESIRILESDNLNYSITNEQYSEQFPAETVIKQIPNAETFVKEGRPIYLTISKGKEKVEVPNLLGLSIRAARLELMKKGLNLGKIEYENSELFSKDSIMEQSISAGRTIPYGDVIDVTISLGSEREIIMPLVVGMELEEAIIILSEMGLSVGSVTYRDSQTFTPNTVIETFPEKFETIQEGTSINLIIAN